jgi:hypothetical protein
LQRDQLLLVIRREAGLHFSYPDFSFNYCQKVGVHRPPTFLGIECDADPSLATGRHELDDFRAALLQIAMDRIRDAGLSAKLSRH